MSNKDLVLISLLGIIAVTVVVKTASLPGDYKPPLDCYSSLGHSPREIYDCFKKFEKEEPNQ